MGKGLYIVQKNTRKLKKHSDQALIQVVQKCWLNGVSTRKIEKIAGKLGLESLSASQVSEINKGLDDMVEEFRNRKLDKNKKRRTESTQY